MDAIRLEQNNNNKRPSSISIETTKFTQIKDHIRRRDLSPIMALFNGNIALRYLVFEGMGKMGNDKA